MKNASSRKSSKKPFRRSKRSISKFSRPSKVLTKQVKQIISRETENKVWFNYGVNNMIPNTITGTPVYQNLIPLLSQGVGKSQRIANEINVKSGYIKGYVNLLPYDATTNNLPIPAYVKIWIISCKQQNTTSLGATNIGTNFFDIVNGTVGMQGNMLDMDFSVNRDGWTVYASKTIKLGVGAITSVGPVGTNGYYEGTSSFSVPFNFNIGKHLKKVKYDDSASSPTNKNMFIIFQTVPANGASGASQIMAEYHYSTRIEYEDL